MKTHNCKSKSPAVCRAFFVESDVQSYPYRSDNEDTSADTTDVGVQAEPAGTFSVCRTLNRERSSRTKKDPAEISRVCAGEPCDRHRSAVANFKRMVFFRGQQLAVPDSHSTHTTPGSDHALNSCSRPSSDADQYRQPYVRQLPASCFWTCSHRC